MIFVTEMKWTSAVRQKMSVNWTWFVACVLECQESAENGAIWFAFGRVKRHSEHPSESGIRLFSCFSPSNKKRSESRWMGLFGYRSAWSVESTGRHPLRLNGCIFGRASLCEWFKLWVVVDWCLWRDVQNELSHKDRETEESRFIRQS